MLPGTHKSISALLCNGETSHEPLTHTLCAMPVFFAHLLLITAPHSWSVRASGECLYQRLLHGNFPPNSDAAVR